MKAKIEYYDEEEGVFWRLVNIETNEIITDGFDSTADAGMYCYDNCILIDIEND